MNKIVTQIKCNQIHNIVVLTGAGISTSSGIPDFRSPGGLYSSLKPESLTATKQQQTMLSINPTLVVDIDLFERNQFPYLEVRRPFIIGSYKKLWKPTLAHYFIKLLDQKGLLRRLYTQNIDGLDYDVNITNSNDKIISVHGTLTKASCEFCKTPYDYNLFIEQVKSKIKNIYDNNDTNSPKESSNIFCMNCKRPGIKASTVMYGGQISRFFFQSIEEDFPNNCDLMIIIGTSLTVFPIASLVNKVESNVVRILFNNNPVGKELGLDYNNTLHNNNNNTFSENGVDNDNTKSRDIWINNTCDEGILYLCSELGWLSELNQFKDQMCEQSSKLLETYSDFNS